MTHVGTRFLHQRVGRHGPRRAHGRAVGTGPRREAPDVLGFLREDQGQLPLLVGAGVPGPARASRFVEWGDGVVTGCQIAAPGDPGAGVHATYTLAMDYRDWKALHEGYDAQRTVMYRKMLLTEGDLLEFFKSIYFFVECLAVIGGVPAEYPERIGPS